MISNVCDLACEILAATNDGNGLAPPDLKLLEMAVNGVLNTAGEARFLELHRNAAKPQGYTVPWFLQIEHMTRDHERYVYWKGVKVEHFDHDHWREAGWQARIKEDAETLAQACQLLEQQGITPDMKTVNGWSNQT